VAFHSYGWLQIHEFVSHADSLSEKALTAAPSSRKVEGIPISYGATTDKGGLTMKAASYIRVSTDEQANEGHSLDAQRAIIGDFCLNRTWTLVGEYLDAGLSGKDGDRPALRELIADAETCGFDLVIVHAVDRFYRNLQGLLGALDRLNQAGVGFVSITENLDFTTPWGKLTLAVLGTLAEIYIDKLSAETSKGKRARKGLYNGTISFGYCKGNCSTCTDPNGRGYCPRYSGPDLCEQDPEVCLWLHPIESVAMRLAFQWYATGQYAQGEIAERLNHHKHRLDDGQVIRFRTKGRVGRSDPGPFCKESMRSLLQRHFYTGVVAYYGSDESGQKRKKPTALYPGQHQPLIDKETFDRCQEVRRAWGRAARNRRTGRQPRVYLLSGLLRCGECGGVMRAQSTVADCRYYRCATRIEHRGRCDQPAIQADEIEGQIVGLLRTLSLPPDWQAQLLAQPSPPDELARQAAERSRLKSRLERVRELYLAGDMDRERYVQEQRDVKQKLVDLTDVAEFAILSVAQMFEYSDEQWAALPRLKQKSLVQMALARATLVRDQLRALQPSYAACPLIRLALEGRHPRERVGDRCHSGSDGPRLQSSNVRLIPNTPVVPKGS
jgi:site-specific DNA recombinase